MKTKGFLKRTVALLLMVALSGCLMLNVQAQSGDMDKEAQYQRLYAVSAAASSEGYPATNAFDGHYDTYWHADQNSFGVKWVMGDFGQTSRIRYITVTFYNKISNGAADFEVQVSNDPLFSNYTVVKTFKSNAKERVTMDADVTGRYVRLYCTRGSTAAYYAPSVREIMVYTERDNARKIPTAEGDKMTYHNPLADEYTWYSGIARVNRYSLTMGRFRFSGGGELGAGATPAMGDGIGMYFTAKAGDGNYTTYKLKDAYPYFGNVADDIPVVQTTKVEVGAAGPVIYASCDAFDLTLYGYGDLDRSGFTYDICIRNKTDQSISVIPHYWINEYDVQTYGFKNGAGTARSKMLYDEWYAKDTSKKIRAVMRVKGNAGEYLATNAPYGYMKDPADKKKWLRDEDAAQVVYEIGLYVMEGYGPQQIARKLKERKILTPAAYYESKGVNCNVKKQGDPYAWDNTTIAHIMDNWRVYLGHTVNFKTTKKSYKSKKKIHNPESEWVIFENTHEPIWTEAIADAVKLARQTRRRPTKMGEMGMFSGMMFCADCGAVLYQCRATGFRKDQEYYLCSGYRKGKHVCPTPHSIRTVILEELVLHNLREIVSFARVHEDRFVQMVMDTDMKQRNKDLAKKKKLLADAEKRIVELDNIIKRLYEDNITGKLTDERFHKLSLDYENEQRDLNGQVVLLREEIEAAESKSADVSRFLSIVKQYTEIPELTPFILHEFVEKIVIHNATDPHSKTNRRQEVDIYYKGIGILEMSKVFDDRQK